MGFLNKDDTNQKCNGSAAPNPKFNVKPGLHLCVSAGLCALVLFFLGSLESPSRLGNVTALTSSEEVSGLDLENINHLRVQQCCQFCQLWNHGTEDAESLHHGLQYIMCNLPAKSGVSFPKKDPQHILFLALSSLISLKTWQAQNISKKKLQGNFS